MSNVRMRIAVFPLCIAAVAAALPCLAADAEGGTVSAVPGRGASLALGAPVDAAFAPAFYLPGWKMVSATGGARPSEDAPVDAPRAFAIEEGGGDNQAGGAMRMEGRVAYRAAPGGAVEARWSVVPDRSADLPETFVHTRLPIARCQGGFLLDGNRVALPAAPDKMHLFRGAVSHLAVLDSDGIPWLEAEFPDGPVRVLVQDNRTWGSPLVLLRFFLAEGRVDAGREYSLRVMFRAPGAALELGEPPPVRIVAGPDWIPYPAPPAGADWIAPGSALDFSGWPQRHEPAGAYGRVVAVGDRFELEGRPGEEFRLYGANLCYGANFPANFESARRFAANYARMGYNAVRFHHHGHGLVDGSADGTTPNPESFARFDALVAALVERGVYLTTDLYVTRRAAYLACGIDRDGFMDKEDYKILAAFHEGVFSNLVAWTRAFLGHVNPYTGRSLAQEPALACLAVVNEGNLGNWGASRLRKHPEVVDAWREWSSRRHGKPLPFPEDFYEPDAALFLAEREDALFRRMAEVVRGEMRCPVPLSSLSSWYNPAQYQLPRAAFDYMDDHGYMDHPRFPEKPWALPATHDGTNPLDGEGELPAMRRRLFSKPFVMTEWNWPAPNRYRGASGLVFGALAARQGYAGAWRFAWSHYQSGVEAPGSVRMRYFDLESDPALCASERAALCLFLRGDVEPLGDDDPAAPVYDPAALRDGSIGPQRLDMAAPGLRASPWRYRLGNYLSERKPIAHERGGVRADAAAEPAEGGSFARMERGAFRMSSPLTAGGAAAEGTAVDCGPLSFRLSGSHAAVWASAVDGNPIPESRRILLCHVTDSKNSEMLFDGPECKTILDFGTTPALVRRGAADVVLRLRDGSAPRVWRLAPDGSRAAAAESRWDAATGELSFRAAVDADPDCATIFYEIARD